MPRTAPSNPSTTQATRIAHERADPARHEPVECDGEPDHDPHRRRVDEGGPEQARNALHAAAREAVRLIPEAGPAAIAEDADFEYGLQRMLAGMEADLMRSGGA
jgi:hypothetical protein